jgi:hypothetical protein
MGRLEHGMSGLVVDVAAGCDPDASHLGCQGVRDVVTVQVHRGDHVVLGRAEEDLLQEGVGDRVLHKQFVTWLAS